MSQPAPAPKSPARQATLRHHNLALVLDQVLQGQEPSRAGIAHRTGLTRATVSSLVDALVAGGLVTELPLLRSRRAGRPAVPLIPARGTLAGLGLEINVDYVAARALDLTGRVLAEQVEELDLRGSSPADALARLAVVAAEVLGGLADRHIPVAGACLALPGLVDTGVGPLRVAPRLRWRDLDLATLRAGLPGLAEMALSVGNEATLAAQAEVADPAESFLYVSGEIGIGGAIIVDGRVVTGRHGWSGEIGHVTVDPDGPSCDCGSTGCLEVYAGADAIRVAAGLGLGAGVADIGRAARAGQPAAVMAVERAAWALGIATATAVNLLDLDVVVLGGYCAELIDLLCPRVADQLASRVLGQPWAPVQVRPAAVVDRAGLTGAARSALTPVVENPAQWLEAALINSPRLGQE